MSPREIAEMLPLTPQVFHVLLVLAEAPRHGYAVMKEVEAATDGRVCLGPGTLYGIVKRLLDDEVVEEVKASPRDRLDGRGKRCYRLTAFGRHLAAAEARRLQTLVEAARSCRLLEEQA